jgi:hypothetical protein
VLRISIAATIVLATLAPASAESKTKQYAKELQQLDRVRDQCISLISEAQRNGNVWPDNATVSLQDCRDMAMKQIGIGTKMMEEGLSDDQADPSDDQ